MSPYLKGIYYDVTRLHDLIENVRSNKLTRAAKTVSAYWKRELRAMS